MSISFTIHGAAVIGSAFFVSLWAVFFYFYSPKKTTSPLALGAATVIGAAAAFLSLVLEQAVLAILNLDLSFLQQFFYVENTKDLLSPLLFSFFVVAVIEETSKFIFLRRYLRTASVNQIIDGMNIGLWVGLGFAFVENTLYFINFVSQYGSFFSLFWVIFLRGILSTLAHGLYGIIMAYYITLGKFHAAYRGRFLKTSFYTSIAAHGFFNFLLIINVGGYSIFILVFLLLTAIMWYGQRKNLELYLAVDGKTLIVPPLLADKFEIETYLAKQNAPAAAFKKVLDLFPPK